MGVLLEMFDNYDLITNVIEDTFVMMMMLLFLMNDLMMKMKMKLKKIFSNNNLAFVFVVDVQNKVVRYHYNQWMMLLDYANVFVSM